MRKLVRPVTLGELCAHLDARIDADQQDLPLRALASLASAGPDELSFLTDSRYRHSATQSGAGAILITEANREALPPACAAVIVDDAYLAFARAAQWFESKLAAEDGGAGDETAIHPNAVIDPQAQLGAGVRVAAGAVIGRGAQLADNVHIGPNVTVGARARIGARTVLMASVSVYPDVRIGEDCLVHSNATLGADGFGFAREGDGWAKIPQLGGLQIGDRCEIGANTSIDRGALDDTRLGNDCVVDNQVQIAHNVVIGDGCALAGCVGIAGSARIGRRCLLGGGSGINGHIELADDVVVSPMAFVTSSIRKSGFYSGTFPLMTNHQWERSAAVLKQLPDLRSRLRYLEKITREFQ